MKFRFRWLICLICQTENNCGCQMVTHLGIIHGLDCLISVIWPLILIFAKLTKIGNGIVMFFFIWVSSANIHNIMKTSQWLNEVKQLTSYFNFLFWFCFQILVFSDARVFEISKQPKFTSKNCQTTTLLTEVSKNNT